MRGIAIFEGLVLDSKHLVRLALVLGGLAGCAKPPPPPPVVALPPAPVGHVYPTLVDVPPAPRYVRMTLEQRQDLQQAFNVIGLKSALMVGALSCGQQDEYDAFMNMYHPLVLDDQHAVDAYFRKIGGRYAGQTKEDAFVTLLANNQTMGGIGQGGVFCLNNEAEFKTVMSLGTPDALEAFVTDNTPEGPVTIPAPVVAASYHHIYHHKKKPVTSTATVAQQ
jgi:hypothetical protein